MDFTCACATSPVKCGGDREGLSAPISQHRRPRGNLLTWDAALTCHGQRVLWLQGGGTPWLHHPVLNCAQSHPPARPADRVVMASSWAAAAKRPLGGTASTAHPGSREAGQKGGCSSSPVCGLQPLACAIPGGDSEPWGCFLALSWGPRSPSHRTWVWQGDESPDQGSTG